MLDWIQRAEGWFFVPQAIVFVLVVAQILYCFMLFRRVSYTCLERKDFPSEDLVEAPKCQLGNAISRISKNSTSSKEVQFELEDFMRSIENASNRSLRMLGMFAQVSMLFGLLGTVVGLVSSFSVISKYEVAPPPSELALGVSQALSTTIIGLIVAIPAFFGHAWLQGRADTMLSFVQKELCLNILQINSVLLFVSLYEYFGSENVQSLSFSK